MKRNAVRRRLKEIFRSTAASMPGGVDIVVSARPAAAEAGFGELNEEFFAAVGRLNAQGKVTNAAEKS